MLVRPGRLLPSVIVGALVTGALALGAGTAAAEPVIPGDLLSTECVDRVTGEKKLVTALLERATSGFCDVVTAVTDGSGSADGGASDGGVGGVADGVGGAVDGTADGVLDPGDEGTGTDLTGGNQDGTTDGAGSTDGSGSGDPTDGAAGPAAGPAPGGPPPAALPAPDVRGLAAPLATAAPGGLAAMVPTLNFGAPNVGLLSPLGSPLRPLTGLTPASPVTTTSDVQAMALDSVPAGLGTPAVVGTLILSALAAFALRHRVLHRARRAAEADTVETPVRASAS